MRDLRFFLKNESLPIRCFPPYNILPFKLVSYHNKTAAERIRLLYELADNTGPSVTVMTPDAFLQKLIPRQALTDYAELLMINEETDRDGLIEKLVAGGYTRAAIVEEPGDFCVRGGIIDIFSPLYSEPLRIELFGDMVESLRLFSATTQRTLGRMEEVVILPAREAILKLEEADQVIRRIRNQAARSDTPSARVREMIERIKTEGIFPGIESFTPLIYPHLDTVWEYVPDNTRFILAEPDKLALTAKEAEAQVRTSYDAARSDGRLCVEPEKLYLSWAEAEARLSAGNAISLKLLPVATPPSDETERGTDHHIIDHHIISEENTQLQTALTHTRNDEKPLGPLADWLREHKDLNQTIVVPCHTRDRAEHLAGLLKPYGIQTGFSDGFPDIKRARGMAYLCEGTLSGGFVWPDEGLAVLTEDEIFGPRSRRPRKKPRAGVRTDLLTFEDLKQGELVVHAEHGIGRYDGLTKLTLNGTTNDFLLIRYKDDDKLYLPVDRMNIVQKYMGVEGIMPVLDKMGGTSWGRVRDKVRQSVEKIAGELLNLYAKRKISRGEGFKISPRDLQSFEASFPYEETPDQLNAIADVFHDMEQPRPMDRLICGDVGYGKTEVALRASFMAVMNGKQVAVLVPTTVLAEQHFETFSKRYENHPVNIACLSRFRPAKAQREIVKGLASGQIDIVIGTHRLLQKDIVFKDPGLIVVDEEQRFGVRHKEKLKKVRSSVDVLALTATPIPRTLHMSLTGIRDISVISTPPEQRRPITTYISELDDRVVAEAIRKELKRGGQIFFVHNSVRSIERMAERIGNLVPDLRLAVAHGSMSEEELEGVMFRFVNRELDLLVCTTIIESGLDVPAANTILVNRADRFGLSQIYQLRGRVGRGDDQAYAYLFIPDESLLTRDARKRLKVLMEHSDLGAGFQIAMSDLKIRGGGTLLGASQSGHIAAVGYDMFLQLMEEAISHIKGKPVPESLEPEINIPLSAFIGEAYIPDIDQRLTAYRRLARMISLKEITDFKAELLDRFGPLPTEAANLLLKIMLKVLAVKAGVRRLDLAGDQLMLYFSEAHQKNPFGIVDLITARKKEFVLTPDHVLKARLGGAGKGGPLARAKNILKEISQRVNG